MENTYKLGRIKFKTTPTHKCDIQAGDTLFIDGELKTVCQDNIAKSPAGVTIFGNLFGMSKGIVQRVLFYRWDKNAKTFRYY